MAKKQIPRRYRIWVVYGPTSEWGDGVGPLAYFRSKRDAKRYLAELKKQEEEFGQWSWRSVEECGHIEEWDARELEFCPAEKSLDEFVDEMNSRV
jgi:hypothetical protein